jgi:hypothetical protein
MVNDTMIGSRLHAEGSRRGIHEPSTAFGVQCLRAHYVH